MQHIRRILPPELWNALTPEAEELRLRVGRTPGVVIAGREHPLSASIVIRATLDQIVGAASGHSSFAALGDGYLSLPGGHRLGFCGSAVVKDGHIAHFRQLSALNLRIAREVRGVADPILCSSPLKNTLLVGPPGCGKTTVLRDLIRLCSERGHRVGVADERGEIAAVQDGLPGFDLGPRTDVLTGGPRGEALELLLRVMSPTVLAMDEIVSEAEYLALHQAANHGVLLLATIHASSRQDLCSRHQELGNIFQNLAFIQRDHIRMERWE